LARAGRVEPGSTWMTSAPWLPIGGWFNGSSTTVLLKSGAAACHRRPGGTAPSARRLRAFTPTVAWPLLPWNSIGNWNVVVAKLITSQPSP